MKSQTLNRFLPLAVLLAIVLPCVALYGCFIAGWLPIGVDNSLFLIPNYTLRWDEGLPLWNPFYLAGTSTFDNLQFSMFYPLRWPFFFIRDWTAYYGLFLFLHYLVAAGGVWWLLRAMRFDRLAAFAGVVALVAGGYLVGVIISPMMLFSFSWLPWLFWSATGRTRLHRWGATGALAMMLTIGQPHILFYGPLGFALVFLFFQFGGEGPSKTDVSSLEPEPRWKGGFRYALILAGHLLLAVVLAAPSFLISLDRAFQSVRSRTDVALNMSNSLHWNNLANVFLGGTGGAIYPEYIDGCCFIGSIGLFLLLTLVVRRDSWRDRRFLCGLVLVVLGTFLALGENAGLQHVMPYIPIYRSLVGPNRALILTALGFPILLALAVERLERGRVEVAGLTALTCGCLFLIRFFLRLASFESLASVPPGWGDWLLVWFEKPTSAGLDAFLLIDAALGLLLAGGVLLLLRKKPRWAAGVLTGLLFVQLWHFSPRVFPPIRRADYYAPPDVIRTLQSLRDAAPGRPFRVDTHDALRLHDTDFNVFFDRHYLIPNYSVLYHLEGLSGFDPMAPLRILELVEQTAGRTPFSDPLRVLTTARPDERLYDLTNVRYLVGHPYDRRVSTLPQTLTDQEPVQPVGYWETPEKFNLRLDFDRTQPITHWLFLSQVDAQADFPHGTQLATLHVEAEEGTFAFPVRYGLETGPLRAYYWDHRKETTDADTIQNSRWTMPILDRDSDYQMGLANYRGVIAFGQPLHVKRLVWEQVQPRRQTQPFALFVGAQACRLAPPPEGDTWRLVAGDENRPAPLFEYLRAPARATLVDWPQPAGASPEEAGTQVPSPIQAGADVRVDEAFLRRPQSENDPVFVERHANRARLRCHSDHSRILVMRELWRPDWKAWVNGEETPVFQINGLLCGLAVPSGDSDVEFRMAPTRFFRLLTFSVMVGLGVAVWEFFRWRRRKKIGKILPTGNGEPG
jgi:hypothetical protein